MAPFRGGFVVGAAPDLRCLPRLLLSFQTHHGRLSERPMEADCKSVAKASKVRILHLPPSAPRGPDQRKRRSGPLACTPDGYFRPRIPKATSQGVDQRKRRGRVERVPNTCKSRPGLRHTGPRFDDRPPRRLYRSRSAPRPTDHRHPRAASLLCTLGSRASGRLNCPKIVAAPYHSWKGRTGPVSRALRSYSGSVRGNDGH